MMASPPQDAETKTLDVTFSADGRLNAIVFWFELDLGGGVRLSTGPEAVSAGAAMKPHTGGTTVLQISWTLRRGALIRFRLFDQEYAPDPGKKVPGWAAKHTACRWLHAH